MKDKNSFKIYADMAEMMIYDRSQQPKAVVLIDKEDVERVGKYKWCLDGHGYAMTHSLNRIKLHQFLIGKKDALVIDHKNHNILDNRKINLHHISHAENLNNLVRGVVDDKICLIKIKARLTPQLKVIAKKRGKAVRALVNNAVEEWLKKLA